MASYSVGRLAALTGISVRTLHYYDEIGLLAPAEVTGAGYRLYDDDSLSRLQQILFFRELGFPLGDIRPILDHPAFDRREALRRHREVLLLKRERIDGLLRLVDDNLKGESNMSFDAFDMSAIEDAKEKYGEEAKARWGGTEAYRESRRRADSYTPEDWAAIQADNTRIFTAFAALRGTDPAAPEARALVAAWQDHISRHFYPCGTEILSGLGQMYTADERFRASLDEYGEGTADFMSRAIAAYCE